MKKLILISLLSLLAVHFVSAKDEITTDMKRLPQPAQNFIAQHFPNEKISYIKIDEELLYLTYEVVFVSGIEVEFMRDGEWKDVDAKGSYVPTAIIPANINRYIETNFHGIPVRKIDKKKNKYDVELTNGLDLEFDMNGNFLRMDD